MSEFFASFPFLSFWDSLPNSLFCLTSLNWKGWHQSKGSEKEKGGGEDIGRGRKRKEWSVRGTRMVECGGSGVQISTSTISLAMGDTQKEGILTTARVTA